MVRRPTAAVRRAPPVGASEGLSIIPVLLDYSDAEVENTVTIMSDESNTIWAHFYIFLRNNLRVAYSLKMLGRNMF